mmetsp:Transcript_27951/g.27805  ORF Transcript_27951/g.27805 Transcript_27951/m.27805 type:complete len:84 (+) Transcript_27951:1084-1335(+)
MEKSFSKTSPRDPFAERNVRQNPQVKGCVPLLRLTWSFKKIRTDLCMVEMTKQLLGTTNTKRRLFRSCLVATMSPSLSKTETL